MNKTYNINIHHRKNMTYQNKHYFYIPNISISEATLVNKINGIKDKFRSGLYVCLPFFIHKFLVRIGNFERKIFTLYDQEYLPLNKSKITNLNFWNEFGIT